MAIEEYQFNGRVITVMHIDEISDFDWYDNHISCSHSPSLTIMRGVSGSGKSTMADYIQAVYEDEIEIVSADHYFMVGDEYRFDSSKLGEAHAQCMKRFYGALETKMSIVVDNTNIKNEHFIEYLESASNNGYRIGVIEVGAVNLPFLPDKYEERNVHSVPRKTIERQYSQFEKLSNEALKYVDEIVRIP